MSVKPEVCVLNASGINCNDETGTAFEMAGAITEQVHISQLASGERKLSDFQILALPGGFSYGDDIASGKVLAVQLEAQLGEQVSEFVERKRGLVIGICNGFQVLVKAGLLPSGRLGTEQSVTLTDNKHGRFECRWTRLRPELSVCGFGYDSSELFELPIAHGEGRFITKDKETMQSLSHYGQIVLSYATKAGAIATEFPDNPNGSEGAVAGICDPTGNILGMMPHPERFVQPWQHPNFHNNRGIQPAGLPIFEAMVRKAKEN